MFFELGPRQILKYLSCSLIEWWYIMPLCCHQPHNIFPLAGNFSLMDLLVYMMLSSTWTLWSQLSGCCCFFVFCCKLTCVTFHVFVTKWEFVAFWHFLRFLGFKKTVLLDRKLLVDLIDQYSSGSFSWDEFSSAVNETHANRMGNPTRRLVIPDRPKEEDYFYANPEECLELSDDQLLSSTWLSMPRIFRGVHQCFSHSGSF